MYTQKAHPQNRDAPCVISSLTILLVLRLSYSPKAFNVDLSQLNIRAVVNSSSEILAVLEDTKSITFLPALYAESELNLVAKVVEGLEAPIISNAHFLKDEPRKRSAQAFLDILQNESVPLLNMKA